MIANVNGVGICYEVHGDGPPIILLHGNGEDHNIFDRLIKDLRNRNRVFAIDSRGHGGSERTDSFHYSDMAEDTASFIRELGIEKPILYGFSDGGIVGLMVASKYPDLLSGLIASGPNLTPKDMKSYIRIVMRITNFFKRDPKVKMMLIEPRITDDDLRKITVPVLITVAEKDIVPVSHAEHIANTVPDGNVIIVPHENHSGYIIHSDRLFPLLSDFLERCVAVGPNP